MENITTQQLISELQSRGYFTDLLYCIEDVNMQLHNVNEMRDERNQILLSQEQKLEVLDTAFSIDWYCEQMNKDLMENIINYEN